MRRGWAAFTAQPITIDHIVSGGLEPVLELFDEEIVWDVRGAGLPEAAEYTGHDGVRRFWMDWYGAFQQVNTELLLLEAHEDKVVALNRQTGRGRGSGTETTMEVVTAWTIRDGKAVRLQMFTDLDEARRAAGLDPAAAVQLEVR